ncbi:MAG: Gfo/Idh/MocA family oxidoreductase [Armatimonadota bacterium]|nr:Gfo/Idh/MocA family oxidoreductase [Armatimonadota bacterium]
MTARSKRPTPSTFNPQPSTERLRTCVIGMGPIGNVHADVYAADEIVELAGVCDIIEERAKAAGERLGVPWFLDAAAMLADLAPNICSIATGGYEYAGDHFEPTIQAFNAGCHVLCEKPISNEIAPAEEMVRVAREKGLCFGIDFNHRFTPAARLAKSWLDEGRLGSLLFANVSLWIGRPQDPDSPYFHIKALNPHSIDMMRHYCGDITKVQCFATKAPGRTIWSTASFNAQFENGAVGHLTSSYDIERGHPMERCEVAGLEGRFVLEDMWREVTLYPAGEQPKTVYTNPVFGGYTGFFDTFRERIRCFVRQIAEGARPEEIDGSGADGLAAQKVIAAAIESLETGRVVQVES